MIVFSCTDEKGLAQAPYAARSCVQWIIFFRLGPQSTRSEQGPAGQNRMMAEVSGLWIVLSRSIQYPISLSGGFFWGRQSAMDVCAPFVPRPASQGTGASWRFQRCIGSDALVQHSCTTRDRERGGGGDGGGADRWSGEDRRLQPIEPERPPQYLAVPAPHPDTPGP